MNEEKEYDFQIKVVGTFCTMAENEEQAIEWVMENGILKQVQMDEMQRKLRTAKKSQLEETKLNIWKRFVESLWYINKKENKTQTGEKNGRVRK